MSRSQVMQGPEGRTQKLGLYAKSKGGPLRSFEHVSNIIQ